MKKNIYFLMIILLTQILCIPTVFAETDTINLHSNSAFILDMDKRPLNIQITNPNILNAESTTEIFSTQSQIVLTTYNEGISYIKFLIENKPQTIKILVDDNAPVDSRVIEIDKIKEP